MSYKLLLTIPLDSILIWSEAQLLWHNPLGSQSLLHCPLPVHNSRTNLECPKLTGTGLELKRRLINANNKSYASFLPLNIRSRKFYCLMGQKIPKMLWFKIYWFCTALLINWQNPVVPDLSTVQPASTWIYTVSQKNVPPLTCYNLDKHEPITIIFGRNVTEKVRNHNMVLCFPISHI